MTFSVEAVCGRARAGVIGTDHGAVRTPAFMPVGTQGTVKGVTPAQLREVGAEMILGNTYHLHLRPGTAVVERAGGLHRFSGWEGPILTDSGGYQVYSLATLRKVDDDGVTFRSHLDGSEHRFTPEGVIAAQRRIGADIVMVLDECPPWPCDEAAADLSNRRTLDWAARSLEAFRAGEGIHGYRQALFGIAQGSTHPGVRERSVDALVEMGFDGYAIGGLAVGEPAAEMYAIIDLCEARLPADRPRYLMGVGTPQNLLEAVERGVDMFDCVLPTRNGRNATAFTASGPLTITNARHAAEFVPVEEGCGCYACANFPRAYLRHLFVAKEMLGPTLLTIHNLRYYRRLMERAREEIVAGTFGAWKGETLRALGAERPPAIH